MTDLGGDRGPGRRLGRHHGSGARCRVSYPPFSAGSKRPLRFRALPLSHSQCHRIPLGPPPEITGVSGESRPITPRGRDLRKPQNRPESPRGVAAEWQRISSGLDSGNEFRGSGTLGATVCLKSSTSRLCGARRGGHCRHRLPGERAVPQHHTIPRTTIAHVRGSSTITEDVRLG